MMTKEEVAQVIAYCNENKVSYKQRLEELGVTSWSFYDAKRKYSPKTEGDNAGEFLQLIPEGSFLPDPIKPARSRSKRQKTAEQRSVNSCPTGGKIQLAPTSSKLYQLCLTWPSWFKLESNYTSRLSSDAYE